MSSAMSIDTEEMMQLMQAPPGVLSEDGGLPARVGRWDGRVVAAVQQAVQAATEGVRSKSGTGHGVHGDSQEDGVGGVAIWNGFGRPDDARRAEQEGVVSPFAFVAPDPCTVLRWESRVFSRVAGSRMHLGRYRTRAEAWAALGAAVHALQSSGWADASGGVFASRFRARSLLSSAAWGRIGVADAGGDAGAAQDDLLDALEAGVGAGTSGGGGAAATPSSVMEANLEARRGAANVLGRLYVPSQLAPRLMRSIEIGWGPQVLGRLRQRHAHMLDAARTARRDRAVMERMESAAVGGAEVLGAGSKRAASPATNGTSMAGMVRYTPEEDVGEGEEGEWEGGRRRPKAKSARRESGHAAVHSRALAFSHQLASIGPQAGAVSDVHHAVDGHHIMHHVHGEHHVHGDHGPHSLPDLPDLPDDGVGPHDEHDEHHDHDHDDHDDDDDEEHHESLAPHLAHVAPSLVGEHDPSHPHHMLHHADDVDSHFHASLDLLSQPAVAHGHDPLAAHDFLGEDLFGVGDEDA